MKSTAARRSARPTLGAARPWTTAGCATAQWRARFARRYPPPLEPPLANRAFPSFCGGPNPCLLDQSLRAKHHPFDPRKQTPGGRHQIGTPAGFKSESVAGFLLECPAGFVGIHTCSRLRSSSWFGASSVAVRKAPDFRWAVASRLRSFDPLATPPLFAQRGRPFGCLRTAGIPLADMDAGCPFRRDPSALGAPPEAPSATPRRRDRRWKPRRRRLT